MLILTCMGRKLRSTSSRGCAVSNALTALTRSKHRLQRTRRRRGASYKMETKGENSPESADKSRIIHAAHRGRPLRVSFSDPFTACAGRTQTRTSDGRRVDEPG